MCPRKTSYTRPVETMDMDLFKKIILDINTNKIEKTIRLSGMGDPSCDKFLIERLRFCKEKAPDLDIVVLSNMGEWPDHYTDIIIDENLLSKIRFSIFAVSEKTSLKLYGNKQQAHKAKMNIERLIKNNNMSNSPIPTLLYTLLLDENKNEMEQIKKTYWDQVDEFEIWRPHNWSNIFSKYRDLQSTRRTCYRIEDFEASIRVNGDVCSCSMDINHNIVYGNLRHQTIEEISNSKSYARYRQINENGDIESIGICKNCSFLNEDESEVLIETK
jgi:radical SAM protein with 4Fe4S-binding SPASM domain